MANLKSLLSLLVFVLIIQTCFAQMKYTSMNKKAIKYFDQAIDYFQQSDFENCMLSLTKAIKEDPEFVEAHLLLAQIFDEQKKYEKAVTGYKKVLEIDPDFSAKVYYSLALNEFYFEKYEDAYEHISKYINHPDMVGKEMKNAKLIQASSAFAIKAFKNPVPFNPVNLGDKVNSEFDEYSPTLTVDEQTLIVTVARAKDEFTITGTSLEEDFFRSQKNTDNNWTDRIKMKAPLNSHGNEGAASITPDGLTIYFTICNRSDGIGSCDIYYSDRKGESWTIPTNLGIKVNSTSWDSEPSISPDGRTLYFASARNGGKGKNDIWFTTKDTNGKWTSPQNIGDSINTEGAEMSPFIHFDGKTLYFLSDGHPGMGRKDIYYSVKKNDDTWSKPKNMGYPINTVNNEGFFIVNARGTTAFYSSNRPGGKGRLDLYSFDLPEQSRPVPVTYAKGIVYDIKTEKPLQANLDIIELSSGKIVAQSSSDIMTGAYLISLPTEKEYAFNVSRDGYLFFSENFSLKSSHTEMNPYSKDIALQPIEAGSVVILKNIFFDFDKAELKPESMVEMQRLIDLLRKNAELKIEIGGHTDNKGSAEYNQKLSEYRSQSVYNYLVSHGIDKNRLSYKGYGLSKPVDSNETEDGRAQNRRTEFKVISN